MARQVITRLVDDIDGGEADETVRFTFDGIAYEIDLSGKNAAQFRKLMDPYQAAGTRVGRVGPGAQVIPTRPTRSSVAPNPNREQNALIREWAQKAGHRLAERGRIPQHVVDEYHAVGGKVPDRKTVQQALAAERVHTSETDAVSHRTTGKKAPAAAFKAASSRRSS